MQLQPTFTLNFVGEELSGKELKTSGEQEEQLAKLLKTETSYQSWVEGVRMARKFIIGLYLLPYFCKISKASPEIS